MRILALTAGAARMYCGSRLRDNALAPELKRQGHLVKMCRDLKIHAEEI